MPIHNRPADAVPAAMTATIAGVRLAALLGLVLLAVPPVPAQGPGAGTPVSVSVSAKQPWVDTGVDLNAGDALTIISKGEWTNGGAGRFFVTPDGFPGYQQPGSTLESADFASMIGKVGDKVFFVGAAFKGTSPGTGRLYLQINDVPDSFDDNSGSLAVEVRPPTPPCTAGPAIRDRLKDGSEGPAMLTMPSGTFLMGAPTGEAGSSDRERPTHSVTIARPFAIGIYEVTFEEYDRFAEATGRTKPDDRGWGRGRQPVINVSWEDARAYAEWLSAQAGARYRLPSEAEWEYAARACSTTAYWWGDAIAQNRANYNGSGSQWGGKQAAPVGSFEANRLGLHDTAGNVMEWVEDCRHDSYAGAPADGSAWTAGDGTFRVIRGGAWGDGPAGLRTAYRPFARASTRGPTLGFRVARDP